VGHVPEGREALNRALDLASDDPDLYFDTAAELAEAQLWVEAAHLYLEAILRFHPGEIPRERREQLAEASYWAAQQPQAENDIPIPRIAEVDPPLERVIEARNLFYRGQEDEAYSTVDQVLVEIRPGMPEALYLQSEIYNAWGDIPSAYDILFELDDRDDTPDWIREAVDQTLQGAFLMQSSAQEQIDQDPENPYVYLPLYEWYLSFGFYEQATETIQQALRLAEDSPDFVLEASDVAARNGAWLEKARLLRYAGQLNPDIITPEFSENIVEALYYGSIEPGALEVLGEIEGYFPDGERGAVRDAYRDALIARYKLYYEDFGEAQALIEEVVARNALLPMPRLVQAEVYLFTGDFQQSERILLELQGSRTAPPWVKDEVQFMLEEINPDS
ncbi:MAG: tetratricopeptide repeat protein, partial [Anaerolineales bacterium]